jgi:putative methyltransferase (TIGR04325 family)
VNLRHLVPPVMIDAALAATRTRVGFTGYSLDFAEVGQSCAGYEDEAVVTSYRSSALDAATRRRAVRPARAQELDSRVVRLGGAFAAASVRLGKNAGLRVLDLGGAYGAQYDAIAAVAGDCIDSYSIVESPAVVRGLADLSDDCLKWVDTSSSSLVDAIGHVDIAISSSTLQYLSQPMRMLGELVTTAPYVLLDRLPLLEHPENFVMKQHTRYQGRPVTYPAWFFSRAEFMRTLHEAGVEVVFEWAVPEDSPFVRGRRRPNVGMLVSTPSALAAPV